MNIIVYTIADLENLYHNVFFWQNPVLPITKQRLHSYIKNPRADQNDVVLFTIENNGQIAGYVGVMPDKIWLNGQEHKLGWLSAWWISPQLRGKGKGFELMNLAFKYWNNKIAAIHASPYSRKIFISYNQFYLAKTFTGINYIFQYPPLNASNGVKKTINKAKNKILHIINSFQYYRQKKWIKKQDNLSIPKFEYLEYIDLETQEFIDKYKKKELTHWTKSELDWLKHYPWIISAPLNDINNNKYYFSATANEFVYYYIKIFSDNNQLIAFIILRNRDGFFVMPRVYYKEGFEKLIANAIALHLVKLNAKTLTLLNSDNITLFENSEFPFIKKQTVIDELFFPNVFNNIDFEIYYIHDSEGDAIFT